MRLAPIMHVRRKKAIAMRQSASIAEEEISPDVIFARVDKTGSGYITLDEFAEAMKMYQIKLNKIGLMKLFLRGDEDAEGLCPKIF